MIPYENLQRLNKSFETDLKQAFESVLDKGYYILGPQLEKFENEFAAFHNVKYCIGVSNGLDALILALRALRLPEGAEVIVPSNTYIATVLAVVACGYKPVLVEPDIATYNIDPAKIEAALTPATAAIIAVHLYGKVCEMDPICELTQRHGLYLLEDCAQAHGATYNGKLAGTFGDFAAFSFYPTKNLGALGDAGGILCNNEGWRNELLQMRNYGSGRKYYNDIIGYNNRLDEVQAAFLSVKLKRLREMNEHRNQLAALYHQQLNDNFIKPLRTDNQYDVFHIYNIRHPRRNELQQYLSERGIGTVIHYPVPPHRQQALAGYFGNLEFPIADEIHETTLSLPCSFCHEINEIEQVIEALNAF
jgi:dTDP-4-amino-4,6-dideoxygalactose transaminase